MLLAEVDGCAGRGSSSLPEVVGRCWSAYPVVLIEVEVLVVVEDNVGNLLTALMWRTSSEVLSDDLLDVEV